MNKHPFNSGFLAVPRVRGGNTLRARRRLPVAALGVAACIACSYIAAWAEAAERERRRAPSLPQRLLSQRIAQVRIPSPALSPNETLRLAGEYIAGGDLSVAEALLWGMPEDARGWTWSALLGRAALGAQPLDHPANPVAALSYSRDGRHIYAEDIRGRTRCWNAATGEAADCPSEDSESEPTPPLASDRNLAVRPWANGGIAVFDQDSGAPQLVPPALPSAVTAARFAPTADRIAIGSDTGQILLCPLNSGECCFADSGAAAPILRFEFDPGGGRVLAVAANRKGFLYDAASAAHLRSFDCADDAIGTFSPDGVRLAIARADGLVSVYTSRTLKQVASVGLGRPVAALAFAPDGGQLAGANRDGSIWVADLHRANQLAAAARRGGNLLRVSHDAATGRTLAARSEGLVTLWDSDWTRSRSLLLPFTQVLDAVFHPGGTLIAVTSKTIAPFLWNPDDANVRFFFDPMMIVWQVAFDDTGQHMLAASADGSVSLLGVPSGAILRRIEAHDPGFVCAAFSPDGALIATGGTDDYVRLWDIATGKRLAALKGHTGNIRALLFTHDCDALLSASEDGEIRKWDLATASLITTLTGHTGHAVDLALHSASNTLLSASADGTVRFWDLATGGETASLSLSSGPLASVALTDTMLLAAHASESITATPFFPPHPDRSSSNADMGEYIASFRKGWHLPPAPPPAAARELQVLIRPDQFDAGVAALAETYRNSRPDASVASLKPSEHLPPRATAWLGLEDAFAISGFNGHPFDSASIAADQLDAARANRSLLLGVNAEGPAQVRYIVPSFEERRRDVHAPRTLFSLLVPAGLEGIRMYAKDLTLIQVILSDGQAVPSDALFRGIYIWDDVPINQQIAFLKGIVVNLLDALAMRFNDRIVAVNGAPLSSIPAIIASFESALDAIDRGETSEMTLDVERGGFLRLQVRVILE